MKLLDEEAELATLVAEVNEATPKMAESIEAMIDTIRKTREHIDETLAEMKPGR